MKRRTSMAVVVAVALALGALAWVACNSETDPREAAPVIATVPDYGPSTETSESFGDLFSLIDPDDPDTISALFYELGRFATVSLSDEDWERLKSDILANQDLPLGARSIAAALLEAAKAGNVGDGASVGNTNARQAIRNMLKNGLGDQPLDDEYVRQMREQHRLEIEAEVEAEEPNRYGSVFHPANGPLLFTMPLLQDSPEGVHDIFVR